MKESNFISAVIYLHDSESFVYETLETLSRFFSERFKQHEIICVNDSSKDNTEKIVKKFAKENTDISVSLITTGYYQGVERAMNAGIDFAIGDFVFQFDSAVIDYELSVIMEVYGHCLKGYDIVNASPNSKMRKSSSLFYKIFNKYAKTQYRLQSESFRIISRRGINRVGQMSQIVFYRKALYANCGLKSDTIKYIPKTVSNSKHSRQEERVRSELAIDSFVLFTNLATKISTFMCVLMLIATLFSGIYAVVIWFIGQPVLGWTTTMLLLSTGLFGLFAVLTMITKYLSLILKLVFERQKYVIENVEKL